MKRFLIGAFTSIILVIMTVPAFANPAGAPPTNKLGPEVSVLAKDMRPLGQEVSVEAQDQIVDDLVLGFFLGLTPPGNTP